MNHLQPFVSRVNRCLTVAVAVITVIILGCVTAAPSVQAEGGPGHRFTFALIGDLAYVPEEERSADNVFADLNRERSLAFVVHVGDLSAPRFSCTDELRARRLAQFRASAHPFVYTPGDNDWTDCHAPAVPGGEPLERLANLRATFFPGDHTLGRRTFALIRQSANPAFVAYRENVRWDLGKVTFLTIHVPGSNNGLGRTPEGDAEYRDRNQANLAWLRQGFEHAQVTGSRAIVILQQANLFPELPPFPDTPRDPSGYAELREALAKESRAFGGPVLLVHGDSHFFRVDQPLSPRRERGAAVTPALENFTRVEVYGSPYHHWVQVTVDASDPQVFSFRPRLVEANLAQRR